MSGAAKKPNFTPGPWSFLYDEEEGAFGIGMGSYLEDDSMYATVHHIDLYDDIYPEDTDDYEEATANAHLIAAAPEMYAKLAELRDEMHCVCRLNAVVGQLGAGIPCTRCELDQLLAKAEGRAAPEHPEVVA